MKRQLKSVFISAYAVAAGAAAGQALENAIGGDATIAWVGATLAAAPIPAFAGLSMVFKPVARTSTGLPSLGVAAMGGLALTVVGAGRGGVVPIVIAVAGVAGYVAYIRWYSWFGREHRDALEVGNPLPEFLVRRSDGSDVSSDSFAGAPVIFVFYRGNWCPLCVAQVREMAGSYRELEARGARVVLVSPQPASKSEKLAERFDAPMEFVVDHDHRAARALGIEDAHGIPAGMQVLGYETETVLPTVIIADAHGTIVFSDQTDNYRVRPEPATYLRVLDGLEPTGAD